MKKALRIALVGFAALVLLAIVVLAGVLNSNAGARWALARVQSALGDALAVGRVEGTLAGPLTLRGVRYHDPVETGVFFDADRVSLDVALSELFAARAHVKHLAVSGMRVDLREPTNPPPRKEPASFDPPLDVLIDAVVLESARVRSAGEPVVEVKHARFAGGWTDAGIVVRQLDVLSPDGEVHLRANVDKHEAKHEIFVGDAEGRFVWKVSDQTYAGTLLASSRPQQAVVKVSLSAPVRATVDATLKQQESLPWTLQLDVPRFEAGKLLEDTQLKHLGARISGSGDLNSGRLAGNLLVNEERIQLTQLQFSRTPEVLSVQSLQLQFRDGAAKADFVGQYLLEERLVKVERLAVVERAGRLTADGEVQLAPQVAWQMKASAQDFDPGELARDWRGSLNFGIETQGEIGADGPSARLKLVDLRGRLRERRLSGSGDLDLRPGMKLGGSLQLQSGRSTVRLKAERGEQLDAVAQVNVASLEDWLADSAGRIEGRVRVRGRWPHIAIDGRIVAQGLSMQQSSVQRAELVANISDLERRTGSASLDASEIAAGDGNWSRLSVRASGDPAGHFLNADVEGEPVAGHVQVRGVLKGEEWNGTLAELRLNVARAGRFELQEPAPMRFGAGAAGIGNTCLAGRQMKLCMSGERSADGSLQARYEINDLPLRLFEAIADPGTPLRAEGIIQGRGDIRRDASGRLLGKATITSASGSLAPREEEEEGEQPLLLSYTDLSLNADLAGDIARITVGGKLNDGGEITGQLQVTRLNTEAPALDGNARVLLASLAPIELFAPQVSAVKGRLEAEARIAGSAVQPQIDARARIADFGTQFPELGIELKDGNFEITRNARGSLALDGRVSSGEGQLTLRGSQVTADLLKVTVRGENFVVANIPAAHVRITPELEVERTSERMQIAGKVTVPGAHVDVQKLPARKAKPVGASADVVVVDDPPAEPEPAGVPLYADVTVMLGQDVRLQGFGLDSQLAGQLAVHEAPGQEPVGSGELRVSGTYKAYGQDLTIQRGSLLFAGTALSNPTLDIVAYRVIEEIRAGLHITGKAQAPLLAVTSEPALSEAEALSYLVTGRPLNSVGAEEGDLVQSAARSLGTAAGNLLVRNVGKRIGVDQVGIEKSEALGGSAFTVGEYLSPRLFVSYGVGLFTPGDVVTVRYDLAEAVQIEASSAPNETRTSIHYRAER